MKIGKLAMAAVAVTVYVTVPAYRYWVIGSWVAYKIANDRGSTRYRIVSKQSKHFKRLVGGLNGTVD